MLKSLLGAALLSVVGSAAPVGSPTVVQVLNSDIEPFATVNLTGESRFADLTFSEVAPGHFELDWSISLSFDSSVDCPTRTDPKMSCSEFYATTHGISDPFSLRHRAAEADIYTASFTIPGSGFLELGPVLSDNVSADIGSDSGLPSTTVNTLADLILPPLIPRGVPFTARMAITLITGMAVDAEHFSGSRTREQLLTNVVNPPIPEPSSVVLMLSGLALISLRLWSRP
jgi:hypothetical protein